MGSSVDWLEIFWKAGRVSLLVAPFVAEAQQTTGLPRIGFLAPVSPSDPRTPTLLEAFRQGLRELGYVEGRNVVIEFRWAEGKYERLPALAAELVRSKVNVIVAGGGPAIQASKQATTAIPIVMGAVADPVAAGFVASLARPEGNITGISNMSLELVGKHLELLKEVSPTVARVALLGNPATSANLAQQRHAHGAAVTLGIRLQPLEARNSKEIDLALAAITKERADALIVLTDSVLLDHRTRIAAYAIRRRLPTVFGFSEFAEAGGLLAYGPTIADGYRRAAVYVDKILKGAKPADLPVEQATRATDLRWAAADRFHKAGNRTEQRLVMHGADSACGSCPHSTAF